jgi:DHA2 family multidrug resistance protein
MNISPEEKTPGPWYRWIILFNVMIGTFMFVLDMAIVSVALPKIMASFGVDVDTAQWIINAFMMVSTIMVPTSGWLADNVGCKRIYILAVVGFTFGSFLCGLAWSAGVLILFRIVQGLGAGFLMPVGLAIVTREFPRERRGMVLGFWGIAAAASISMGPVIGGYLIDSFGWPSIFFLNVPVGVMQIILTLTVQREYRKEERARFDLLGFLSMVMFLGFLLLALANGNARWNIGGWTSPYILTCFALSTVGLVVFLTVELTVDQPLVELRLFRNANFAITNLVLFVFGLGMFGSGFLMPLFLQNALGYTAFQTGALFLPIGLLHGCVSPLSGILSDRINPKILAFCGISLMAVSLYINSNLSLYSENSVIMLALYIRGFGMGLAFTPLTRLAIGDIPFEKMAQASGLFNLIRRVGGSFGIATIGAVYARRINYHLAVFGAAIDRNSPLFQSVVGSLRTHAVRASGSSYAQAASQARALVARHVGAQAFVRAIDNAFLFAAVLTVLGALPILFLKNPLRDGRKAGKPDTARELIAAHPTPSQKKRTSASQRTLERRQ